MVRTILLLVSLLLCAALDGVANAGHEFVYPVGRLDIRPTPNASSLGLNGYRITGPYRVSGHTGVDLANGQEGGEVRAVSDGTVVEVQESSLTVGYGNLVRIRHEVPGIGTVYSQYAHLKDGSIRVSRSQGVATGAVIGQVDCTGYMDPTSVTPCPSNGRKGSHLHFSIQLIGDRNGCAYLPDSRCPSDTFGIYFDPLQFMEDRRRAAPPTVAFGPPVRVAQSATFQLVPRLTMLGPAVHVIWTDFISGQPQLAYRRSVDGGATFGPVLDVSEGTTGFDGQVGVSGSSVFLAWRGLEVWFRKSADNGTTFGALMPLALSTFGSLGNIELAASGSTVAVVWTEGNISSRQVFLRRSTDGGSSFGPVLNLSGPSGVAVEPKVAVSNSAIAVAWIEGGHVRFRSSVDGGTSFGSVQTLSFEPGRAPIVRLSASGSTVGLVWRGGDAFGGVTQAFFRGSSNGGLSFGPIVNLSGGSFGADPDVAVVGCTVHAVWLSGYRRSLDCGASFEAAKALGVGVIPSVGASETTVGLVWQMFIPPSNDEVFFAGSRSAGMEFAAAQNISQTSGGSFVFFLQSSLAVSGSRVAVAWMDSSSGAFEIFVRVGTAP